MKVQGMNKKMMNSISCSKCQIHWGILKIDICKGPVTNEKKKGEMIRVIHSSVLQGKRPLGRPKKISEDKIRIDVENVRTGENRQELATVRVKWQEICLMVRSKRS